MKESGSKVLRTIHIAFLRGINVGGHKPVKMDELKKAFASLGFGKIKTFIASGNVAFEAPEGDPGAFAVRIKDKLKKTFGCEIGVILRTAADLRKIVDDDPFRNTAVTPDIKLYITFLPERTSGDFKVPDESPKKDFRILNVSGKEIFSMVDLSKGGRTVEAMNTIEKEFGRNVTTRNWNTILKLLNGL